jgi:hypothetical protein
MEVLEIVLAGTANFDNLRRHSDEESRTYQSSTAVPFLQRNWGSEDETSPLIDKGCLLRHTTGPQEQFEEIRALVITRRQTEASMRHLLDSFAVAGDCIFALLASYQIALPRQVIREKRNKNCTRHLKTNFEKQGSISGELAQNYESPSIQIH